MFFTEFYLRVKALSDPIDFKEHKEKLKIIPVKYRRMYVDGLTYGLGIPKTIRILTLFNGKDRAGFHDVMRSFSTVHVQPNFLEKK